MLFAACASPYAVLTHQAIIDSVWDRDFKPTLLKRFPHTSSDDLDKAHAYAYGGCIIQDMGYYPLSSKFFSDLTHYVRSGDFVEAMIREASDVNEYAFALGSLAHYAADNTGHPFINRATGVIYPKLVAKYGPEVTYEDNPVAHMKTEFGFDVLQVARGLYPPQVYRSFIGFQVSKPLLERAFQETYGFELKNIFFSEDLAFGTYRHTVSLLIPEMTKVAWDLKKDDIQKAKPGYTREKFLYNISQTEYKKEFDGWEKPGIGARILAWFLKIIPKFGPLRSVSFKPPTPATEQFFLKSFNDTIDRYRGFLTKTREGTLTLANENFDTGRPTRAGEYHLSDKTYRKLLDKLLKKDPREIPDGLRTAILRYYEGARRPIPQLKALRGAARSLMEERPAGAVTAKP